MTTVAIKRAVPTIQQVIKVLQALDRQLDAAKTYEQIRRLINEAEAVKALLPEVQAVKEAAEDSILLGNRRIAEELRKVPKAGGPGRSKKISSTRGKSFGRDATGIKSTKRHRLGKLADVSKADLKAVAARLREHGKDATVNAVVREITQGDKKQRRARRERELARKITAMPAQRYGVIYADPPWKFEPYSQATGMDRAADNHYPTMDTEAIKRLPVPAADDCVLFLWATVPMLDVAIDVLQAWGFTYKSNFVWTKDKAGTGFWNKNKHEHLLVGVRGNIPAPAPGEQYESAFTAARGRHSAKPFAVHEMIEAMFPTLPRIELFAREQFEGWDAWGNEAEAAE